MIIYDFIFQNDSYSYELHTYLTNIEVTRDEYVI